MAETNLLKSGDDQKSGKVKEAKIKLTKEQKAFVKEQISLQNRIKVCLDFIGLWKEFFKAFSEDREDREITLAEEKAFFQLVTKIARKQFMFTQLMGDHFDRGEDLMKTLAMAPSLTHIENMPEASRSKLEMDWHGLYLDINKTLGHLLRMLPGEMTLSEALRHIKSPDAFLSPKELKKKASDASKDKAAKPAAGKKPKAAKGANTGKDQPAA